MRIDVIAMAPWDFTLYESSDGTLILKVMFSVGDYKTDVGRYFAVDHRNIDPSDIAGLKKLASRIRAHYPNMEVKEVDAPPRR